MDELRKTINDLQLLNVLFPGPLSLSKEDIKEIIKYLTWLRKIGEIAEEAFNNPETANIGIYREQALANIYAIFLYDGKTLKEDTES